MNDISKPDLREDPKDMAPDVLRDMAKWIKANCLDTYDDGVDEWFCKGCDWQGSSDEDKDVAHAPECEVQVLLDLATAAGASK